MTIMISHYINSLFDQWGRRWLTLFLAATAVAVYFISDLTTALEYHRGAVLQGQAWRIFTGHFTHWNADHLLWDALMFAVVGCWIESRGRSQLAGLLLISTLAISLDLIVAGREWQTYRGLSGIDSALFAYLLAIMLVESWSQHERWLTFAAAAGFSAFLGKIAYESLTGHCLFVDDAAAGFIPMPRVHFIGAVVGTAWGVVKHLECAIRGGARFTSEPLHRCSCGELSHGS